MGSSATISRLNTNKSCQPAKPKCKSYESLLEDKSRKSGSSAKYVVDKDHPSEASDDGSDEEEHPAMVVLSEKASDDVYKVGCFFVSNFKLGRKFHFTGN